MKKILIALVFSLGLATFGFGSLYADAATRVSGYTTKKGTYVHPYYKSTPNKNKIDNYSTKGNYNSYTGKKGYVNPYKW